MTVQTVAEHGDVTVSFSGLAFYARNRNHYLRIWEVLGRTWRSFAGEVAWAVDTIPGPDHGLLRTELTKDQRHQLLPVLKHMGFFRALDVQPGVIDELKVTGAKFGAMVTRLQLIRRKLELRFEGGRRKGEKKYTVKRIKCQFGHRPRTDAQDGTVAQIVESLSANVLAHPWVQKQLGKTGENLYEGPFATEFDLGTLAWLVAYDGNIVVGDDVPSGDKPEDVLPGTVLRTVASRMLTLPDGTAVDILNCPAVERRHGPARPTTDSSTAYWLDLFPPEPGSRIVVVSGPTHGYRVAGDFERRVHSHPNGRSMTVHAISRETADPEAVLNNALAEAVWLLVKAYEETAADLLPALR